MDFDLPEELVILKNNVRRFVDTELIPLEKTLAEDVEGQKRLSTLLAPKVEALGLRHFDVPEEFGGLGLGMCQRRRQIVPDGGLKVYQSG